jgi:hypothetical protein
MSVDDWDHRVIRDADMVGLNPDQLSILLMSIVDAQITLPQSGLEEQPEVGKLGSKGTRDLLQGGVRGEVWHEEEEHQGDGDGEGGDEEIQDGHGGGLAAMETMLQEIAARVSVLRRVVDPAR